MKFRRPKAQEAPKPRRSWREEDAAIVASLDELPIGERDYAETVIFDAIDEPDPARADALLNEWLRIMDKHGALPEHMPRHSSWARLAAGD